MKIFALLPMDVYVGVKPLHNNNCFATTDHKVITETMCGLAELGMSHMRYDYNANNPMNSDIQESASTYGRCIIQAGSNIGGDRK